MFRIKNFLTTLLVLSFLFPIFLSHAEVVDKILVIVNDEIITQGDVDRLLLPVYTQYKGLYNGRELEEKFAEVRSGALKRLIEDKLLLAEAKRKGIEVAPRELEGKLDEVKGRFSTEEGFSAALAGENILLSGLEKQLTERLMIEKFVSSELQNKVSISPTELLDYYERHLSRFKEPRKVRLGSILIKINEDRPENEAMRVAQKILYRLREGSDFGLLAKQYSDGPYRDSGGDMGWVSEGQLMDRINDLVFQMQQGEISSILKTRLGFHLFKIEGRKDGQIKEFAKEKERIEKILYAEKRKARLQELIEDLRENAYIAFR